MRELIKQIIKFGIVGVIATAIDYAVYALFTRAFSVNIYLSEFIAFAISLVVNFLLSMKFVFKANENLSKTVQIVFFTVSSVIGFFINLGLLKLGDVIFNYEELKYMDFVVKVVATGVSMAWNFVSKKLTLERKSSKKN